MSTMFVKNVRKITVLPNHRMHASSKKRMRKLIRKSSMLARAAPARGGPTFSISELREPDVTVAEPAIPDRPIPSEVFDRGPHVAGDRPTQ